VSHFQLHPAWLTQIWQLHYNGRRKNKFKIKEATVAKKKAVSDPDPCAQAKIDDEKASKNVPQQKQKHAAAWRELNILKDTIDPTEFAEIKRILVLGDWPEDILGPLDNPVHNYATLVKCAKNVYNAFISYKEAQETANATSKALRDCKCSPEYRKWVNDQANRSACGAPCTSWGHKGQSCKHMLTAKRCCPNHGQRPILT
jgi:hypothetical protein